MGDEHPHRRIPPLHGHRRNAGKSVDKFSGQKLLML